LVKVPGL